MRISGLSPLARGTHCMPDTRDPGARFIPAGAGNTWICRYSCRANTVYPRWRGEHSQRKLSTNACRGLSPLARGTPTPAKRHLVFCRFIPAGAGNTSPSCHTTGRLSVYPRWRGEHMVKFQTSNDGHGLSPLARGTQSSPAQPVCERRFIPAGAGNTRVATLILN